MWKALSTVLFFTLILHRHEAFGDTENNSEEEILKNKIVSDIIRKVTNLTSNAFAKVPPKEKAKMLTKIRDKLTKASTFTGPNSYKYVDLVMEGVEVIARGVTEADGSRRSATVKAQLQSKKTNTEKHASKNDKSSSIKNKLVRSIAKKIETLTKVAFFRAKTREEKEKIMENIKKRVIEAAKKNKIMIRSQVDGIKPYGELVVEGVQLVLQKEFRNGTEWRPSIEVDEATPVLRSRQILENSGNEINMIDDGEVSKSLNQLPVANTLDLCDCNCIIENTCTKIYALNTFTCRDKTVTQLDKMCDGKANCFDQSDEEDCAKNAIKKLRNAGRLLSDIQALLPRKCLKTSLEDDVLTNQNEVLDKVLKQQIDFIKRNDPTKNPQFLKYDNNQIKVVVNDVSRIVSTVGIALEASFCVHEMDPNVFSRRAMTVLEDDMDELFEERSWAPPKCTCKEEFCAKSNCTPVCQRTCWQRFSLSRWPCAAISTRDTVELEVICDGKADCYDESDEIGCSAGKGADKFDARNMYNDVLNILASKVASKEYHPILNQLNALQNSVVKLQELSTGEKNDVLAVSRLRETCFTQLTAIYDKLLDEADDIGQVDEAYLLLSIINEKLVGALKHSQTGNEKIVVTSECLCQEDQCKAITCSPTCRRACSVKPKLTKYTCTTNPNITIHLNKICNSQSDCPNGEDENNCKGEICRNHHLVLLRNEIQKIKFNKGYTVTEVIKAWKTKATATLTVLEKRGRSTRPVLQKVVADLLQDLTMSYAALGEVRRTVYEQSVDDFLNVALRVQDMLRSCSK